MPKKKINRGGLIPYIKKEDEIYMLFMKPSKAKFGGDVFQIAKGKQEEGEDIQTTALREANEELGFKADLRDYGVGAQILVALGVRKMRLMTNNPKKIIGLEGYGLEDAKRIPIETDPKPENVKYLITKCQKLGHLMNLEG